MACVWSLPRIYCFLIMFFFHLRYFIQDNLFFSDWSVLRFVLVRVCHGTFFFFSSENFTFFLNDIFAGYTILGCLLFPFKCIAVSSSCLPAAVEKSLSHSCCFVDNTALRSSLFFCFLQACYDVSRYGFFFFNLLHEIL